MADMAIPSNGTVPVTDIVRAHVAGHRVAMQVNGPGVIQLRNITALPSGHEGGGYSFSRLQSIDNLIERIRLAHGEEPAFDELSAVEKHEVILEEAARVIVEESKSPEVSMYAYQGMLFDMSA